MTPSRRIVTALGTLVVALAAVRTVQSQNLAPSIIGTWTLVAIEGVGRGTAPDDQPYGTITYDNTGHMAVQIVYRKSRRPARPAAAPSGDAYDTYGAYFGTYQIDARRGVVNHHIEGSLDPNDVGKNLVRFFELRGNRVTYYVAEDGRGGLFRRKEETVRRVTWERIPTN